MVWHIWGSLLLASVCSFGSEPFARYRYTRMVDGSFAQQEMVAIDLDARIWQVIGTAELDLRIADQDGRVTPHLTRRAGTREKRMTRDLRASRIAELSDHEGNHLELVVALEKHAADANVIFFETPRKDFEKSVTVWGLHEGEAGGTLLVEKARIFDYSRFADVRETTVVLPEQSKAYHAFRIRVEDVVDETQLPLRWETRRYAGNEETVREEHTRILTQPFRMNAVRLYQQREIETGIVPRIAEQTFSSTTTWQESDPAATVVELDHNGAPLTALMLVCNDGNFSRRAIVEIPVRRDGREVWQQIGAGQLSRISFRDFQHEALQLPFPETRSLHYRLTLFDHDNPPLQELAVKGKGPIWQAVFLAEPAKRYTLYYGADGHPQPPRYDLAPLERLLQKDHVPMALRLEAETANPAFHKTGFLAGDTVMRILFAVAISVMLAVLALGLYRAARQIP